MKKEQVIALTVSILCALALMIGAAVSFFNGNRDEISADANKNTEETTTQTELSGEMCQQQEEQMPPEGTEDQKPATEKDEKKDGEETVVAPPTDLPPVVEIPPEADPITGEPEGLKFPCSVPGYNLKLEKLAPYDGMFVENGTNVDVKQVAMLMVKNEGDYPIEYAQLEVTVGQEQLQFHISALPVGETLVVQEFSGKTYPEGDATAATALVVQRVEMEMSEEQIRVTDVGENRLKIENLTDQDISSVRVFYKYYMKEEGLFVGGIAFTVKLSHLGANSSITIQPAHYNSKTGRVVMVRTYE